MPAARAGQAFARARAAENAFGRALRAMARVVQSILRAYDPANPRSASLLQRALEHYGSISRPWARKAAESMVEEVAARDLKAWFAVAKEIGSGLRHEIRRTPIGERTRALVDESAELITSLPLDAARKVQEMAIRAVEDGDRGKALEAEIMRLGQVTQSRARLIARTEVGRAASALTQARAESVGSTGYIWRTSKDQRVRDSHRAMEGRFVAWAEPPTLDGLTGHAGALPHCRCWAEPVLPDQEKPN